MPDRAALRDVEKALDSDAPPASIWPSNRSLCVGGADCELYFCHSPSTDSGASASVFWPPPSSARKRSIALMPFAAGCCGAASYSPGSDGRQCKPLPAAVSPSDRKRARPIAGANCLRSVWHRLSQLLGRAKRWRAQRASCRRHTCAVAEARKAAHALQPDSFVTK